MQKYRWFLFFWLSLSGIYVESFSNEKIFIDFQNSYFLPSVNVSNNCPDSTVDLSIAIAIDPSNNNLPANSILSFHSGTPATAANELDSTIVTIAGTYYVSFKDTLSADCYSGTTIINVTIDDCPFLISNTCPSLTLDLETELPPLSAIPIHSRLSFHSDLPVEESNELTDLVISSNDSVYVAFKDTINICYSDARMVIVTMNPCIEFCDNGEDDDGDGLVDCDDSDCRPSATPALLSACDNTNGGGIGQFFLHDINTTVNNSTGISISYHGNLADAQSNSNILLSPYNSSATTIYVRVENDTSSCFSTSLITLNIGTTCAENCINGLDDDGDGLIDCDDSDCPCCEANAPSLLKLRKK